MKFSLGEQKFANLIISTAGAKSFDDGTIEGDKKTFFIYKIGIQKCLKKDITILLGNWFQDILRFPALLEGNSTVKIQWPSDEKVIDYNELSEQDKDGVIEKLEKLSKNHPFYDEIINKLIENIRKEEV